jgi:hypothetical protein
MAFSAYLPVSYKHQTTFCIGGLSMHAQSQSGGKILVAYFSWSGNAKVLTGQIAQGIGGDLTDCQDNFGGIK